MKIYKMKNIKNVKLILNKINILKSFDGNYDKR